ncbi:MAG: YcxB family protein [Ferruginibacter sp.]
MTSEFFTYHKSKVIQALRYHFISRIEIKALLIAVNVFAIFAAALFYLGKIRPQAFLISSILWFSLMIVFWFILPALTYRNAKTFLDKFRAVLGPHHFIIENDRGSRTWSWSDFSNWMETPHFFHLYFNSRSFFLIPKDAFEDDEVHEARKIFKAHIKKSS